MAKIVLFLFLLFSSSIAEDIYDTDCAACHQTKGLPDHALYRRYLLTYSSEAKIKKGMMDYLKNPSPERSVMPEQFITKFGIKEPTKLPDERLENAIDEMIEKYKISNILYLETR